MASNQKKIWADNGYIGVQFKEQLLSSGYDLEIVKRSPKWKRDPKNSKDMRARFIELFEPNPVSPSFEVLPRRWVVERTFSWLGRFRRLSKDYEFSVKSSISFILLALMRLMLKRLQKALFAF